MTKSSTINNQPKDPYENSNHPSNYSQKHEYLFGAGLISPKRKVPNEEGALGTTRHRATVDEHFVERNRQGGVTAMDDHSGGISDEADVDSGGV